jgi:type I restriction enzyme S subunit
MAGRYQEYPEYKNSGVRFFNYIPQHWGVSKVRFISSFGRGLAITKANLKDKGIPCVSYGEVHSKFGFEVDPKKHNLKCVDEEYLNISPDALLSKGDFVFADTSEDIDGSGNFTQLVSDETLFAGYHTVVVRPTSNNYYRFLAYLFDSPEYRTQVRDAVKGVKVFSVTQAILKNTNVLLPTHEEQQKIANFLDYETAKIDTLIAKQEKLIALLKEKRQAVISHAVTRGLNHNAQMKDSGVEWLGEVPEHWAVIAIKRLTQVKRGASPRPIDDQKYFDESGEYAWVRIADVSKSDMYLVNTVQTLSGLGSSLSVKLEPNELFVSIN